MNTKIILLILLLLSLFSFSQVEINESNFNEKLSEDIVVVEFYAEWNKSNMTDLSDFKDVKTYLVNIEHCPGLTKKYKILSVPTLIIFNNKEIVEKYEADLTFQLSTKQAVKKTEELVLKKFM
tara:strand:- start:1070 stop:1438 length:369 start_codon:yes stop_codon:yes gene_type:complete